MYDVGGRVSRVRDFNGCADWCGVDYREARSSARLQAGRMFCVW